MTIDGSPERTCDVPHTPNEGHGMQQARPVVLSGAVWRHACLATSHKYGVGCSLNSVGWPGRIASSGTPIRIPHPIVKQPQAP